MSVWMYMSTWMCLCGVMNESCECVCVEVYVYVDVYVSCECVYVDVYVYVDVCVWSCA